MPSKRRTNQCVVFDEDTGRRCRKSGQGDPSMCKRHRDDLQIPSPLGQVFDAVIHGRSPSPNAVADAMFGVVEGFLGRKLTADERARATSVGGGVFTGSGSRSSRSSSESSDAHRAQEAEARARASEIGRARRTLGFGARDQITPEILKARYRELARKWHPDRYVGDPAKQKAATSRMAEINAAMEILQKPV